MRAKLANETYPKMFGYLERLLKKSGPEYFVGGAVSPIMSYLL